MKNRNSALIITMLFCGVMLPLGLTNVTAHPPDYVVLYYDNVSEELTVSLGHTVSDPSTHYVKTVAITINSVLNVTHTYPDQPTGPEFNYTYFIPLVDGDIVSVTAVCNLGGDFTATLTIGEEPTTSDDSSTDDPSDDGASIPGYTVVAMILSLMTLGILFQHRRQQ